MGHCWRSKDNLTKNVLLWIPSHGRASVGWLSRTYLQQHCTDTGCSLEDLLETMDDKDKWWKRVREIHASSMTWWWLYGFRHFNSILIIFKQINLSYRWDPNNLGQNRLWSNGNEGILPTLQISRTGTSPSDAV